MSAAAYDPSALDRPVDLWGWKGLSIVGTGMRGGLQTTPEARICIEQASKVLYLVADPVSETWIKGLNPSAESLYPFYAKDKPRQQTYAEIVERILEALRTHGDVCVALYGHPGVFATPAHEALRRARLAGHEARMIPGVSSLDNLFSDLGLDPGASGLQCHDTTAFLLYQPRFEPTSALVLWQVGVLGEARWVPQTQPRPRTLGVLRDQLLKSYPATHPAIVYQTAELPMTNPSIVRSSVAELASLRYSTSSTLFVPPLPRPAPRREVLEMMRGQSGPEG